MSTHIITIASSKGGVGKSTCCIAIAGALLARNASVHIVDLDENRTVLRWFTEHRITSPGLSVVQVAPTDILAHLRDLKNDARAPDYVLIDVAGVYEKALIQAMARSNLVIIPAQPSEPDVHEARKVIRDLAEMNADFNGNIPYRLLLNLVEPLDPHYQRYTIEEVARLKIDRFETLMHKRAPYREMFLSGRTPHQDAQDRPSVAKAVAEINSIIDEVEAILAHTPKLKAAA